MFLGDKSLTFSLLSKATLYSLKVKSSIAAPFKEIEPIILWFSNWILLLWFKASSLVISVIFSFWSKLGASVFCSVLFFSAKFSFVIGGGAKYKLYKIITAVSFKLWSESWFTLSLFSHASSDLLIFFYYSLQIFYLFSI